MGQAFSPRKESVQRANPGRCLWWARGQARRGEGRAHGSTDGVKPWADPSLWPVEGLGKLREHVLGFRGCGRVAAVSGVRSCCQTCWPSFSLAPVHATGLGADAAGASLHTDLWGLLCHVLTCPISLSSVPQQVCLRDTRGGCHCVAAKALSSPFLGGPAAEVWERAFGQGGSPEGGHPPRRPPQAGLSLGPSPQGRAELGCVPFHASRTSFGTLLSSARTWWLIPKKP